jgi:ABC-2 type transport system permease protein
MHLGVVDLDGTPAASAMVARLEGREGITLSHRNTARSLRRDVRSTALEAGVVIPKGYSAALAQGHAAVDVVVDPSSAAVATALTAIQGAVDEEGVREGAVHLVATGDVSPAAARRQVAAAATHLHTVTVRSAPGVHAGVHAGTYSYTAPSNLVLFVFINTFAVSTLIATDRKQGLIRRLLVTPNRPGSIVLGIGVAKLAFALVQSLLILTIGALAFGVPWGDPVAALLLVVVFAMLSTAIGLIVGSVVSNADQAQSIGIPFAVGMGMLGGCMWPLTIVPAAMRTAGHLVPQAWAMDAWQTLIFDRGGIADIATPQAVLGGATVVLSAVAVRSLRRTVLT